jgi:hypothetical protein
VTLLSESNIGAPARTGPKPTAKWGDSTDTLLEEWAYVWLYTSDAERCEQYPVWLHTCNDHRGQTALGGQPPASRVPNLSGLYT